MASSLKGIMSPGPGDSLPHGAPPSKPLTLLSSGKPSGVFFLWESLSLLLFSVEIPCFKFWGRSFSSTKMGWSSPSSPRFPFEAGLAVQLQGCQQAAPSSRVPQNLPLLPEAVPPKAMPSSGWPASNGLGR